MDKDFITKQGADIAKLFDDFKEPEALDALSKQYANMKPEEGKQLLDAISANDVKGTGIDVKAAVQLNVNMELDGYEANSFQIPALELYDPRKPEGERNYTFIDTSKPLEMKPKQ